MGNRLDHNLNQGMEVNFGSDSVQVASNNIADGIVVGALKNARVKNNTFLANGDTGLFLFDLVESQVSGNSFADNAVVANVSNANQGRPGEGGGIVIVGASGNTVTRSIAIHNLDVGVGIFEDVPGDSAGNRLAGNTANANGAHGIDLVDGTIDGGGNIAHRNTPPPNCLGVVCS